MICPKCREDIFLLVKRERVIQEADVTLDAWGFVVYEQNEENVEEDNMGFYCPTCNRLLFMDTKRAEKFLKGEDKCRKSY